MNIHEYQAKELLAKYGIAVPAGHAALTVEEAVEGAKQLPGPLYVVKAQIHAGGRGKGKFKELGPDAKGGVRLSKSIEDVEANAREMLGNTLVTVQTGDEGKQVNRLYVTDGVDIAHEYYLSMLVDRASDRFFDGHRCVSCGNGDAVFREQFLGLVFVDVHFGLSSFAFSAAGGNRVAVPHKHVWPRLKSATFGCRGASHP